jgi:uncharacterized protein (TIGR02444 family)
MKIEAAELTGPHWAFALALYGKPGVAESCLLLQDQFGVDVNVLLIALYCAAKGAGVPSQPWLRAADDSIADLRAKVIMPLRQARRDIKGLVEASEQTESIRKRVKGLELEGEQLEQALLARLVPDRGIQPVDFIATIEAVVRLYSQPAQMLAASEAMSRSIRTIAMAASQHPA